MDEKSKVRLVEALMGISEGKGAAARKAGATAQELLRTHEEELLSLAEDHHRQVSSIETWKGARGQWGKVEKASRELLKALEALGPLACTVRQDAAVLDHTVRESTLRNRQGDQIGGGFALFWDVKPYLPMVSGNLPSNCHLYSLESFAGWAQTLIRSKQEQCNGAERKQSIVPVFLLSQVRRLCLACSPTSSQTHAERITKVIHDWATDGKDPLTTQWAKNAWKKIGGRKTR